MSPAKGFWSQHLANERRQVERLQWLLAFAQGRYTAKDLVAFAYGSEMTRGRGRIRRLEGDDEINALRNWLLKGFETVSNGEEWIVDWSEIGPYQVIVRPGGRNHYEDQHGDAIAKLEALHLFDAQKWRIVRCALPGCGKVTIRKKRGAYCEGGRCSQRMRTLRQRHPERIEAVKPLPRTAGAAVRNARTIKAALRKQKITKRELVEARKKLQEILQRTTKSEVK